MVRKAALSSALRSALAALVVTATLCVAAPASAERHWQCGGGITVPFTGTREERDGACQKARADAERASPTLSRERERALRERIEKLERQDDVDTDVKTR